MRKKLKEQLEATKLLRLKLADAEKMEAMLEDEVDKQVKLRVEAVEKYSSKVRENDEMKRQKEKEDEKHMPEPAAKPPELELRKRHKMTWPQPSNKWPLNLPSWKHKTPHYERRRQKAQEE